MQTIKARATEERPETAMKRTSRNLPWSFFVGLMVATGFTAGLAAPASAAVSGTDRAETAAAAVVPACVDFLALADNTVLGNNFTRDGYKFQALGGLVPFVNESIDMLGTLVHGAQFDNSGLRVSLPAPADAVDVTMGVFSTPGVQIRAFDAFGAVVDSAFVPADLTLHTVTLDGAQDITRLRFIGGGNEGTIEEICGF